MPDRQPIQPEDKYCFVDPDEGFEHTDYEYQVVAYGPTETEVRDPHSRDRYHDRYTFDNTSLYVTPEQRERSERTRIENAQAIGRTARSKTR